MCPFLKSGKKEPYGEADIQNRNGTGVNRTKPVRGAPFVREEPGGVRAWYDRICDEHDPENRPASDSSRRRVNVRAMFGVMQDGKAYHRTEEKLQRIEPFRNWHAKVYN